MLVLKDTWESTHGPVPDTAIVFKFAVARPKRPARRCKDCWERQLWLFPEEYEEYISVSFMELQSQ